MISKVITLLLALTVGITQQQQASNIQPDFDWNMLKSMLMSSCNDGLTSDDVLTNVT